MPATEVRVHVFRCTGEQAHTCTYMRYSHAKMVSVHLPRELCVASLKRCERCLWPRMLFTWITLVPISEKKMYRISMAHFCLLWTHCQPHIKVLLSHFPASNSRLPQHTHSMSRPQVSMVTEKRKAQFGSLNSKNLAHQAPKGLEYWSPFPLFFESMSIKI